MADQAKPASNRMALRRLSLAVLAMFGFGYALVPLYNAFCEVTGINVLALSDQKSRGQQQEGARAAQNTQVDGSRLVTVEFDANTKGAGGSAGKGLWDFTPAVRTLQVHPGELATVMYEFQNTQDHRMAAQAIPSYAPSQSHAYFNKLECFCFTQYTLEAGEKKQWPVVFVIDPKLPRDITTITLSYTFFEVGGKAVAQARQKDML